MGFLYAFWRRRHASPNPTKSRTEQRQGGRLGYTRPRYLDQGFVSCNGLTWSNRRRTDLYVRWWGRGGAARCPLSRSRTLDGQATSLSTDRPRPKVPGRPSPVTAAAGNGAAVGKTQLPAKTGSVFYYSRHRTTAGWISGSVPAVQNRHCRVSSRLPRVARSLADEQARVLVTVLRVFVLALHQHTAFDPRFDDVLRLLLCRVGTEFLHHRPSGAIRSVRRRAIPTTLVGPRLDLVEDPVDCRRVQFGEHIGRIPSLHGLHVVAARIALSLRSPAAPRRA